MSTVGTLTKLATGVIGKTAHAVTHPVATVTTTVTTAAGQVHKVATALTGGSDAPPADVPSTRESEREEVAPEISTPDPAAAAEAAVAAELAREQEPEPDLPEVTEPKAASRESAHRGRGADPTDDWHDELDEGPDVETAAGIPGTAPEINPATGLPHHAPGEEESILDPSVAKAIRKESGTLRKAAKTTPDADGE